MKRWEKLWLYAGTAFAWACSQLGITPVQAWQGISPSGTEEGNGEIYLVPGESVFSHGNSVNKQVTDLFSNDFVEMSHYSHSSHSSHRSHYSHYSGSGYYGGGNSGYDSSNYSSPSSDSSSLDSSDQTASTDIIPVTQIQKQLNDLGYDCGAVDGVKGSDTIGAIEAFQHDYDLSETGVVDWRTEAYLDSTNIDIVRAALTNFGYDCGDTEGRNQETIEAIYDFQDRHGLSADGRINPATKQALGI